MADLDNLRIEGRRRTSRRVGLAWILFIVGLIAVTLAIRGQVPPESAQLVGAGVVLVGLAGSFIFLIRLKGW